MDEELVCCPKCGNEFQVPQYVADRVSIHGMYDCHLFHSVNGNTVDEVIMNWLDHNSVLQPAIVGDREVKDLGPSSLGPAIVMSGKKELRRVGRMIMPDYETGMPKSITEITALREAWLSDPDIPRLLAEREKINESSDTSSNGTPRVASSGTGTFPFD
jgi:hypothetical protein